MRVQFYTSYLVTNCVEVKCFVISVFKYIFFLLGLYLFLMSCINLVLAIMKHTMFLYHINIVSYYIVL